MMFYGFNYLNYSQVAVMFQNLVMEDGIVEITDISEKQESKSKPSGLNTVNLLKVRTGLSLPFAVCTKFVLNTTTPLLFSSSLIFLLFGFINCVFLFVSSIHILSVLAFLMKTGLM